MDEKEIPKLPYVRMNLTGDPSSFEEGEYAFMLNGVIEDLSGNDPYATSMAGMDEMVTFPDGFLYLSRLKLNNDQVLVFLVNLIEGDSQIGIIESDFTYNVIAQDPRLGFRIDKQIQAKFKTNYKGHRIIYWVDDSGPIWYLNIDNIPFVKILVNGSVVTTGQLDVDQMKVFKNYTLADITISSVVNNGILPSALYFLNMQYADAKGNGMTAWGKLNGPVPIFHDSLDNSYEHIAGSEFNTPTSKAIKITVDNADLSFTHINIGIIRMQGGVPQAYKVATIPVTQKEYIFTGAGTTMLPIELAVMLAPATVYKSAKTIEESDGSLILGNLKGKDKFNYQRYFNEVQMLWQVRRARVNSKTGNFKNPINSVYSKTYRADEQMPFGMVLEFTDGTDSDIIIFKGRRANFTSDGHPIGTRDDQFGDSIPAGQWDTQSSNNFNDVYEPDALPRWKVYNTATIKGSLLSATSTEGLAEYGEFGYWESTDRYPDDPQIWGQDAGQPIRIPKFPDSSVIHIHDGFNTHRDTSDYPYVNLLGVVFPNLQQIIDNLPTAIKSTIKGYRIVRGDRTFNKSVVASGIIFNNLMQDFRQKITDPEDFRLIPNYPLNDLRPDAYINHPYENNLSNPFHSKTSFTFVSPDTAFNKTILSASELKINAEVYGKADCSHAFLTPFPTMDGGGLAGTPRCAMSAIALGWYNNYRPVKKGNTRRKLVDALYVPMNAQVASGNIGSPVYNTGRESCVLLAVTRSIDNPINVDHSRFAIDSDHDFDITDDERFNCDPNRKVKRGISAYYVTLKNNIPNQYGTITDMKFVDTGFGSHNIAATGAVFGGDTFVGLFSQKRQMSFYNDTQDWMDTPAGGADMDFNATMNIPHTRHYYRNTTNNPRKESRIMCTEGSGGLIPSGDQFLGYIVMVMYGVPTIFTESEINLDLRLASSTPEDTFYPNLNGGSVPVSLWLNVKGIDKDNLFAHNSDYSYFNDLTTFTIQDPLSDPTNATETHYNTRAIKSLRSQPEDIYDNWQIFLPLDYYDFKKSVGDLIDIRYIGNGRTLFRFEKSMFEANLYDTLQTGSGQNIQLGKGRLFTQDPVERFYTDDGYVGTSSQWACDVTEFGTFMVDMINRKVSLYNNGPSDLTAMKADNWFFNNMDLRLKRQLPGIPIDNPANPNGIGFVSTFDHRTKSWVLTKRDYEFIYPTDVHNATYEDGKILIGNRAVELSDARIFINRSWTMTYTLTRQGWTSYLSYVAVGYVNRNRDMFSFTSVDGLTKLWRHYSTSSVCKFHGVQFPFIIESNIKLSDTEQSTLTSYSFISKAFQTIDDAVVERKDITFDKVIFYNDYQSSGLLNMVRKDELNLATLYDPLAVSTTGREVALRTSSGKWNIADIYDLLREGQPAFISSWNNIDYRSSYFIDKVIVHQSMDYFTAYPRCTPMRGTWLRARMIYSKPAGVKLLLRVALARTRQSSL